jgi:hypothetical protein
MPTYNFIDLTGRTFGRLTVLEQAGISKNTLRKRLYAGWAFERAFTVPSQRGGTRQPGEPG